MKNSYKKIISVVLTIIILLTAAPMSGFVGLKLNLDWLDFSTKSSALESAGQCGDNVHWTFDESTGTLTISGTGDMYDFVFHDPNILGSDMTEIEFLLFNNNTHEGIFSNSSIIKLVVIEQGVTSVGRAAFKRCSELTSIFIPDSVIKIGDKAFEDCVCLTDLTIGNGVMKIGDLAFNNTGYYNDLSNWDNNVLYIGKNLYRAKTVISGDYIIKSETKSICSSAFSGCSGVTNVAIPDSVKSIGNKAFEDCTGLTSVTIPDSVTSIGSYVFSNCTGLTNITLPDSITSISDSTFSNCKKLANITIPESVTTIGNYAFYQCTGLRSIIIPDSVTSIFSSAFSGCTGLTSVTIPDSVTSISGEAFSRCSRLTTVNYYAAKCTSMRYAFDNCYSLSTLNIGSNVKSLPDYAFSGCTGLTSITIPENVETISDYAFKGCTNLKNVVFNSEDYINIGAGAFDECYNAVICCKENSYMHYYADRKGMQYCIIDEGGNPSFTVENDILVSYTGSGENIFVSSASKIGFAAFDGNENLKSVELASNVTRIYNQAFRNCSSLEKIVIPKSVTSIGSSAFSGCDNLTIWCYAGSYAQTFAENHDIPYTLIKLDLSQTSLTAADSETLSLTASFTTDLIDEDKITWTSSDTDVAVVENGIVNILDFGEVQITASTASGLSAECLINVDAKLKPGVDAEIDREENLLSGADIINKNPDEIKNMFANSNVEVSSETSKAGTGSTVTLYRANGGVFKEIEILIYGDVNSDGVYDAQDAFIVNCIANGMLTREQVGEAKFLAADCNHDGEVNSSDVLILEQAGLLLSKVEQAKDEEMKEQALGEYLDLINQNPEINEADKATEEKTASIFDRIIDFVKKIIDFLKSILAKF